MCVNVCMCVCVKERNKNLIIVGTVCGCDYEKPVKNKTVP